MPLTSLEVHGLSWIYRWQTTMFCGWTAAQATSMWPGVLRRKVREFSGGSYGIISPGNTSLYELKMVQLNIPSGYVKIAIENSHRNSGFSHETWWFSSSLCKRLPGRVTYSHGYVCILKRFLLVHHHDCHDYIYIFFITCMKCNHVSSSDHHLIMLPTGTPDVSFYLSDSWWNFEGATGSVYRLTFSVEIWEPHIFAGLQ